MTVQIEDSYRGLSYRVDFIESHYPWQIREGIRKALSLSGYTDETIDEVFGTSSIIMPDVKSEDPYIGERIVYTKRDAYRDIQEAE